MPVTRDTPDDFELTSIVDEFSCVDGCEFCAGTGHVCEEHPGKPWGPMMGPDEGCHCGGAGMPCPGVPG